MHVAIDARSCSDHFPGIGRYVAGLLGGLAALADRELTLSVIHDPRVRSSHFDLAALAGAAGAALAPVESSPFELSQQWRVPALLKRLGAELYHAPYYLRPYGPLPCRSVTTLYDCIPRRFPSYFSPARRLLIELTTRLAILRSHRLLTISKATISDLERFYHVRRRKVALVLAGVEPRFRPAGAEAIEEARGRYQLPERYVLYLGSNKPHKNLPLLVEAWLALAGRAGACDAALVVGGAWDPGYPQARELAERACLGRQICWVGPVEERHLPALYSGAEIFVFPSQYEGFGLPPLEAMACGAPTIISSTPALREVAGDAALVVEEPSAEALARAIAELLGDQRRRDALRERGLRRAGELSWQRTAELTVAAYREALS